MIKANELRIGNWVQALVSLNFADYLVPSHTQVDAMMIRDCQHYKDNWAWGEIPLNPEILEKAGGKSAIDFYGGYLFDVGKGNAIRIKYTEDDGWHWYGAGNISLPTLHQLQNLYFALTGTELNIEL